MNINYNALIDIAQDRGAGRTLEQLKASKGPLKGQESQRLRTYCTSECMEPGRDLDLYGRILFSGELAAVKNDFELRSAKYELAGSSKAEAHKKVSDELYKLAWGPTRVPIYNLMLLATMIYPERREGYLEIVRWLIDEAKVPVNGTDLSGSTAIHHAISCKPAFDPEFAQILYDAGGDVNLRNRYGGNAAHESTMIWDYQNPEVIQKHARAIDWFLTHGGSIDIKDNDTITARMNLSMFKNFTGSQKRQFMPLFNAIERADRRRKQMGDKGCKLCLREESDANKLMICSRCKTAKYCAPPRACQKVDWPRHKEKCKAPAQK